MRTRLHAFGPIAVQSLFGAVVDLFLPVESKVLVEVGQRVDSGSTVLAELIHSEPLSSVNV